MRRIRECHEGLFESAITERVIGAFYAVYNGLGYGYLESVYHRAMAVELQRRGLSARAQAPVEVTYEGTVVGAFRADLLVEQRVVVELKSGRSLGAEHEMQLLNYLKATDLEIGLLLHFGPRATVRRLIWSNAAPADDHPRSSAPSPRSASARAGRDADRAALIVARPPSRGRCPGPPPAACPTP